VDVSEEIVSSKASLGPFVQHAGSEVLELPEFSRLLKHAGQHSTNLVQLRRDLESLLALESQHWHLFRKACAVIIVILTLHL